ncbi:MAG: AAA family ATPase [Acidimicrobiia bacterium]|nr:AAA family ATPase [Acidimicrobiia bacterium]
MFLERDRELGLLTDLLGDIEVSGGAVVLLRGEAGIGKSALVEEFVARNAANAHVLLGASDDLLTPAALGPFWDFARDEVSLVEHLENSDRSRVLGVTLDLLSRALRPTILVFEDTQWADEATLDAIKYLGRRISTTHGLLILTFRETEVDYDHPLRGVIGDLPPSRVVRISLSGISVSAVAEIIGETGLDPDEVLAATGGNPFLVTQVASTGGAVPSSIQDSIMARVRKLSPEFRRVLTTLSVIPERIERREALRLAGSGEPQVAELERLGLLEVEGETVAFRHELIRRAIEASLTESDRIVANREVLELLPNDADPARLVHHARMAGDTDRLVDLAPRAARAAAAVGSHREAVDHFRQLTPLLERVEAAARGPVLDDWAREELLQDNIAEAIHLNELAVLHYQRMGNRVAESAALGRAAQCYEMAGERARAEALGRQAVEVLGPDPNGLDLARAIELNAWLATMAGDWEATLELADQAWDAAGNDADEWITIRCLYYRGTVAAVRGYPAGRPFFNEARERAAAAGLWYEECRARVNAAWDAYEAMDLPVALDLVNGAIASAVQHEQPLHENYGKSLKSRLLELGGNWAEAEDLARDQLDSAAISQMVVRPLLGALEARSGRSSARATLSRAWAMAETAAEFQRLAPTAAALAEYAWIYGQPAVPEAGTVLSLEDLIWQGFEWSAGSIALWRWANGEVIEVPRGVSKPYRVLIDGDPLAAAEMWSTMGCPYERAVALAHGHPEAQLEALEVFEDLGATAVAAKVRKSLRNKGVAVPRGRGQKTRDHAAGLTARQAEVLALLDEGMSNIEIADALFLSRRTVEHHVSAILGKLGCATREEAVAIAMGRGLLPDA